MTRPDFTLDVDLDAGFRAVAGRQLAGTWQVPAELVRMAVACGAREVDVRIQRRMVVVAAPGTVVPRAAVEALASLLNGGADRPRLEAIAILEDLDATALAWAAGARPRRFEVVQRASETTLTLARMHEGRASITESGPTGEVGCRVVLAGSGIEMKRAAVWLETACRFTSVPIRLNGRSVQRELNSGCFRAVLHRPVPATVALGVLAESPRLWLLRHGVLEARVAVPGWPAFEAAVELSGEVAGWVSPADLRRVVGAHLPRIIDSVVALLLKVVPRLPEVSVQRRSALVSALLTAVEKHVREDEVMRAPMFEIVHADHRRWVSLDDLDRRRTAIPPVVEPHQRIDGFEGPLLHLESKERGRVAAVLGVDFPRVATPRRRVPERLREALDTALELVRDLLGPAPVPESSLDPAECRLARGLASCLRSASGRALVTFVDGDGPVRCSGPALRLPRGNPVVRACASMVDRDATWLYPAALAVAGRRWAVEDGVRRTWICDDDQKEPGY